MTPQFKHFDLRVVDPLFGSKLTDTIIELEKLRGGRRPKTKVNPFLFSQLKQIFHTLESLASVRIEGNNTTLSDVVEKTIDGTLATTKEERIKELMNAQSALKFAEEHIQEGTTINRVLISELHKKIVDGLDPSKEGDETPGVYRNRNVTITKSNHKPPDVVHVNKYTEEFISFINDERDQKRKILATAIAHHRFVWIHPFGNGNGRTVRAVTYAMLISQGFALGRLLNPTAVFCTDRARYVKMLAEADTGTDEGLLAWCEYVLESLLTEIRKIDYLLDYDYLLAKILIPALDYSLARESITVEEYKILKLASEKMIVRAGDINKILNKKFPAQVSAAIKKLKGRGLLVDAPGKKREYTIWFANNVLLRGIIDSLRINGFIKALD